MVNMNFYKRRRSVSIFCFVVISTATFIGTIFAVAPKSDVSTTIDIAAPPTRVWAVLTDTKAYPDWNPEIAAINGPLTPGAIIKNGKGYGSEQQVFRPTVLTVKPNEELRWRGQILLPRLFDAEHYFLLHPSRNGTLFTQGEHFKGVCLWFFDVNRLVPSFNARNAALKLRAEARGPQIRCGEGEGKQCLQLPHIQ